MRRLAHIIFYSIAVVLWLVVLAAAAELYPAYRWGKIAKSNCFVLAYQGHRRWPDLDEQGNPLPADDAPLPPAEPPPFSPPTEQHLGTRFSAYAEEDRATYALLNDEFIAIYEHTGANLGVYGTADSAERLGLPVPSELAGKPLAESPLASKSADALDAIRRVFDTSKPYAVSFDGRLEWGDAVLELAGYPMKDADGTVTAVVCTLRNISNLTLTERTAREIQTEEHPMWVIPWVEYKRYAQTGPRRFANNVGFPDDDVILPKPEGVFRIACVGGSTTEEGFTHDMSYPNVLEAKLNAHFNGTPLVDVINCGVVGLDSLGEKRRMADYLRLEPDLIVEYNGVNDICHALFPMWEKEWERDAGAWDRLLRRSRFLTAYADWLFWPSDDEMAAQLDRSTIANLGVMAKAARERGVPMAIASFACPDIDSLTREERDYY